MRRLLLLAGLIPMLAACSPDETGNVVQARSDLDAAGANAADATDHEGREEAAAIGDLRLAVGAKDEAQVDKAEIALREAGALQIDLVRRG